MILLSLLSMCALCVSCVYLQGRVLLRNPRLGPANGAFLYFNAFCSSSTVVAHPPVYGVFRLSTPPSEQSYPAGQYVISTLVPFHLILILFVVISCHSDKGSTGGAIPLLSRLQGYQSDSVVRRDSVVDLMLI